MLALLRRSKLASLRMLRSAGAFALCRDSEWRRRRLLILCFHGVSIEDEHEWSPGLYISLAQFERRLNLLREGGYNVLSLDEGLRRLREGALPPRSAAITFDDGMHDFYLRALPVLTRLRLPATVYQTTYYCQFNRPIFQLVCSYMLWRRRLSPPGPIPAGGLEGIFDLSRENVRQRAVAQLARMAEAERLSGAQKDALAAELAGALGIDYDDLCRRRILHVMNPQEVRDAAAAGIDFQLHTHRHRTPLDRDQFSREVEENREAIQHLTGRAPRHFCYPSGVHLPLFQGWLEEFGIASATTCEAGLAAPHTPSLALPRLLDHGTLDEIEFVSWLDGVGGLLPRRRAGSGLRRRPRQ